MHPDIVNLKIGRPVFHRCFCDKTGAGLGFAGKAVSPASVCPLPDTINCG